MKKLFIPTTILLTPFFVFAQSNRSFQEIASDLIITGSNYVLRLLVALTLFVFLYGLMKYLYKGQESDTARTEGRKLMLWGIIGLFVMTSIWALIALLTSVIGHEGTAIPQFKGTTASQSESAAPYGRFADGTPLSAEEYAAGENLRRTIPVVVDNVSEQTDSLLNKAKNAGSGLLDNVNGGLKSINNLLNQNN